MKDKSTYIRADKTAFTRTKVWYHYGHDAPLQEFIVELTDVMQSIPEEHRSKAMFMETTEWDMGRMEIYYDEDVK